MKISRILAFLLAANCAFVSPSSGAQVRDPAILELHAYARSLVKKNPKQLADVGEVKQTMLEPMSAYVTPFKSNDPTLLTQPVTPGSSKTIEANEKKTARWHAIYCTEELQAILKKHGIFSASGQLYDSSGQRASLSSCIASAKR